MTRVLEADEYLGQRTGCYDFRSVRYARAAGVMAALGLYDTDTIFDIGAGMTEFDHYIRVNHDFKGRYIPVDAGIDGTDLDYWNPPRKANYAVALEIFEHLHNPARLIINLQATMNAIIASVPNPRTVDVLGIDDTHVTIITADFLQSHGFTVVEETFYGGTFSNGQPDSLFAVWSR